MPEKATTLSGGFRLDVATTPPTATGFRSGDSANYRPRSLPAHLGIAQAIQDPDWFRDAKFGIWAHWTAQCVPEAGDWYARQMYIPERANTIIT